MSTDLLHLLCLMSAMAFWIVALIHWGIARTFRNPGVSPDMIQCYQTACRGYWIFLQGNTIILVFNALNFEQALLDPWEPIVILLSSAMIIFRWRSDRQVGQRLIDQAEEGLDDLIANSPQ